jgi:DNA-binding NtrC family response regulator
VSRVDVTVATSTEIELHGGRFTIAGVGSDFPSLVVGPEPVLVGRDPSCQLVLDDKSVSAVHAELVATPHGVRVRDLGSKNGTWAGDVRIVQAFLTDRATVWLGQSELTFAGASSERLVLPDAERFGLLYGKSAAMREVFRRLAGVAPTDLTVLVQGETGTGKDLVAQSIHQASRRKDKPFVVVDCGSIAPSLAEATLFGHERGAFTGASDRRVSPFVEANGGTIFLDELGELPLELQPKLLRALAERRIKSVGSNTYTPFDARVVAATRRDLVGAVNTGAFRSDLYFRVAEMRIEVPALRTRAEDIPGLVRGMLTELGSPSAYRRIKRGTLERILRHDWPGNVRELKNAVSVALALADDDDAPLDIAAHAGLGHVTSGAMDLDTVRDYHLAKREALDQFERGYFACLVAATAGNLAEISRRTGLQRTHVRRYLRRHGLRGNPASTR